MTGTDSGPKAPTHGVSRPAPVWIFPLYVAGLVLVYLGERVLVSLATGSWVTSLVGVLLVVVATTLRYAPRFRVGGERKHIEQLLGILSMVGLCGVAIHFGMSDWASERLGLGALAEETRDRLESILTVTWIVLIAVSVLPMAFAETASFSMRLAERPEARRVRSATAAGLTLVLAAVYCTLLVFSARGLKLKADYSYFRTSEPSESTRKIVESLDDPLTIRAFYPEVNEVKSEVERYLSKLAPGSNNLRVELLDRLLVPKLAQDMRVTQDGTLTLSYGKAVEQLRVGAELNDETRKKLKTLDRDLQEVLLKLARSRRTAYFTVGHEELNDASRGTKAGDGVEVLQLLLKKQNYTVKDLGLGQGLGREVPDDADIVFVVGPTRPFSPEEIDTLKRYADRGGKLFLALDPDALPVSDAALPGEVAPATPPTDAAKPGREPAVAGLRTLAEVVGLNLNPTVLANDKVFTVLRHNDSDHARLVTNQFSSHAAVSTLSRNSNRLPVVVIGAGSLEKAPTTANSVDFSLRTMPGTFGDLNRNYRPDSSEKPGNFNLAAAVSRPIGGGKPPPKDDKKGEKAADKKEMRAFVVTDSGAFTDVALANVFGNQVLVVDAVRWLGGEESFAGQTNVEEDVKIEHTKQQDLVWYYLTIIGAPAAVLALGLWYSLGTRKKKKAPKAKKPTQPAEPKPEAATPDSGKSKP